MEAPTARPALLVHIRYCGRVAKCRAAASQPAVRPCQQRQAWWSLRAATEALSLPNHQHMAAPRLAMHGLLLLHHAVALVGSNSFNLSNTLGDHMVLQRAGATLWGFGVPGAQVTTAFHGRALTATVGADAIWRVNISSAANTTPTDFVFRHTGEPGTVALRDVLFGDVFLCGGISSSTACYTPFPPHQPLPVMQYTNRH